MKTSGGWRTRVLLYHLPAGAAGEGEQWEGLYLDARINRDWWPNQQGRTNGWQGMRERSSRLETHWSHPEDDMCCEEKELCRRTPGLKTMNGQWKASWGGHISCSASRYVLSILCIIILTFIKITYINWFWWGIACLLGPVCRGLRKTCGVRFSPYILWFLVINLKSQDWQQALLSLELINLPDPPVLTHETQGCGGGVRQNHPGLKRNHQCQRRTIKWHSQA